jgi:hypothetical protein
MAALILASFDLISVMVGKRRSEKRGGTTLERRTTRLREE